MSCLSPWETLTPAVFAGMSCVSTAFFLTVITSPPNALNLVSNKLSASQPLSDIMLRTLLKYLKTPFLLVFMVVTLRQVCLGHGLIGSAENHFRNSSRRLASLTPSSEHLPIHHICQPQALSTSTNFCPLSTAVLPTYGRLSVCSGNFTYGNLTTYGNLPAYGNLIVYGNLTVYYGNLTVYYGNLTDYGNLTAYYGNLTDYGNLTAYGNLIAYGN
ncbi:hypothetical protein K435DRAFT_838320, partial [Dendrothele bispora CBS 962.96]